jgi:hypothetical protein
MTSITSLAPLTPLIAGIVAHYLVSRREDRLAAASDARFEDEMDTPRVFRYPRGIVKAVFASAVVLPLVFLLLPDSAVQDARPMFNFAAVVLGGLLLFAWAYLHKYSILVTRNEVRYGAFRMTSIDLRCVTAISYFWVGNGVSLKLFSGDQRIGLFEGGVENFDTFAKMIRRRLPKSAREEVAGRASFG